MTTCDSRYAQMNYFQIQLFDFFSHPSPPNGPLHCAHLISQKAVLAFSQNGQKHIAPSPPTSLLHFHFAQQAVLAFLQNGHTIFISAEKAQHISAE